MSETEQAAGAATNEARLDLLRHAVGADARRGRDGYRNYFVAEAGGPNSIAWDALVRMGFAVRGREKNGHVCYHVTAAGCRAIGLSTAATKRAMEGRS